MAGGILIAGVLAAGLALMGAGPAAVPAPASDARQLAALRASVAKALATPRLYRVTRRGGGPVVSTHVLEMCLGAAAADTLIAGAAAAEGQAGCSRTLVARAGGAFHLDLACDQAAGAKRTAHVVLDGTVKDLRQSLEVVLQDPGSGDARIVSMDVRMTDVGACPTGLAPGQARGPDGKVSDAPGEAPWLSRR
jgi:hypothetical protein